MHRVSRSLIVLAFTCLSLGFLATLGAPPAATPAKSSESKAKLEEIRAQVIAKLRLTPQQQQTLDKNKQDHRNQMRTLLKKLREAMKTMREELQKPAVDRLQINAIHTEMKGMMSALADLRLEGIMKIREILTPEQHRIMLEEFRKALPEPPPLPEDEDPLLEDNSL